VVGHRDDTVEGVLARLAFSAFGLVNRPQLLAAGVTSPEIRSRLKSGALLPEHRGVYRVGHRAPSTESTYLGAVWACGSRALLKGRPAGHLLGLTNGPAPPPEVMAPVLRRVRGVNTSRYRVLHPGDATVWRGIPVTSVARTLVDLAAVLSGEDLARACHEAGVKHRTTPAHVEAVLKRRPNSKGASKLRAIMHGDIQVSLSELERRFRKLLRRAGLPVPDMNKVASERRVDGRWPDHRLTVELNSYRYHNSRHAWETDYERAREAYARGDEFRQYTWRDVFEDPARMMAELRGLLSAGDPT
jgi:hypothetical protein